MTERRAYTPDNDTPMRLDEAEDVFVCMADATGIDRHNHPTPYIAARSVLSELERENVNG